MNIIDLTYYDQQTILYAKGWFKKTDLTEDLKKIVMKEYALSYKNVQPYSISHFVVDLFQKLGLNNEEFLLSLFDKVDSRIDYKDLIIKMIDKISQIPVLNLDGSKRFDLAQPDFTLFPEAKEIMYRLEADTQGYPLEEIYWEHQFNEALQKYNEWNSDDEIFNVILFKTINNIKIEFYKDGNWIEWNK